jgi:COMPASS component SWD1
VYYLALIADKLLPDPFAQKYPDVVDATLVSSANCARFNPSGPFAGHYLATGELDGLVQVWDTETRGVARVLEGHVKTVSSVWCVPITSAELSLPKLICCSWSRNNRYLLSASLDSTAIIWDLSVLPTPSLIAHTPITEPSSSASSASSSRLPPTQRVRTIRFDAPLAAAELHPRNGKIILATLTCNEVVLVDLRSHGSRAKLEDVMDGEEQADEEMQVDGEQQARDRKK